MDWIFDNFQILALVGLALASWLKSRSDAKAAEREAREARKEFEEPEEFFGPAENWREVIERPAPVAPPPVFKTSPPPVPATPGRAEIELKRQAEIQERLRQIRETKAVTSGGAAATRARATDRKVAATAAIPSTSLRSALRQRGQIRRAVVLREILGPPLGLR